MRRALLLWMLASAPAAAQSITFGRHAAAPGDSLDQSVRVEMALEHTGRKGAEVLEESRQQQVTEQTRRVTATEVDGGRVVAARVRFFTARTSADGPPQDDPIAGRSYLCRRDGERLTVTTPEGLTPSIGEYALVTRAMATLGTASPLAKYLAGRTLTVGERIELPSEVAQQALGFNDQIGTVERFTLTLTAIEQRVARFDSEIEAVGHGGQQMRLFVGGDFCLDADTCRVVTADLSGPLAMSAVVGDITLDAKGRMRMALATRYQDAPR